MFTRLGAFDGKAASRRSALLDFAAEILGVARHRLALAHDPRGAPLLLIDDLRGDWNVSSASREDVWLFGLAQRQKIGVDVEIVHPIDPPEAALHAEENKRLAMLADAMRAEAFYEIWTAKEAYLKALGVGLRVEPSRIRVTSCDDTFTIDKDEQRADLREARWRRQILTGRIIISASIILD
jgi:4'-phosphopantetheinyl transferase